RLPGLDPGGRRRADHRVRALHRGRPQDRGVRALSADPASAEAGGLLGHAPGGGDVRDRVDAVRGPDSGLDPLARRDRRDRGARRGTARGLLGRPRRAVPAVVAGARGLPQVFQALPAVHPDRRARGGRAAAAVRALEPGPVVAVDAGPRSVVTPFRARFPRGRPYDERAVKAILGALALLLLASGCSTVPKSAYFPGLSAPAIVALSHS